MFKKILLVNIIFLTACSTQMVKEEKYISTGSFRDDAYKICMNSKKYKQEIQESRKLNCQKDAQTFITIAKSNFREYKADEHNYRLCRSKFSNIQVSDKCFKEQQEKYYRRELNGYKAALN